MPKEEKNGRGSSCQYDVMRIKGLSRFIFFFCLSNVLGVVAADDPAPPRFHKLADLPTPTPQAFDRLAFHQAPKPLSQEAKTSDWPRLLGPSDNVTSPETH